MSTNKIAYESSGTSACTLASLATSSTSVAGRASAAIDNTSNLDLDIFLAGKVTTGTSPTAGTIEVWLIPQYDDTPTWPDTFGGTDAGVTVTSRDILFSSGMLIASINTDTTSNRTYYWQKSAGAAFGGPPSKKMQVFIVHNTAVNLNSTAGNHAIYTTGVYSTST